MTCLIIGTSNTARREGYRIFLKTLQPDLPLQVEAVGATTSALVPYVLSQIDLSDITHVAIDTFVNDAVAAADAGSDMDACNAMLYECVEWLLQQGKQVIFLLMPQTRVVDETSRLRRHRLAFAAAKGVQVVDGCAVATALTRDHELRETLLFIDPQHPSWTISMIVAQRLLTAFAAVSRPEANLAAPPLPYTVRRLAAAEGKEVERKTSLATRRYTMLAEGDTVSIDMARPVSLMAIAVNSLETAAILEIATEQGELEVDIPPPATGTIKSNATMLHHLLRLDRTISGTSFRITVKPRRGATKPTSAEVESLLFRDTAARTGFAAFEATLPVRLEQMGELVDPPLSAAETAIAVATSLSSRFVDHGSAAGFYRRAIVRATPIWEWRHDLIVDRIVQLGALLGETKLAMRMLRDAMAQLPNSGLLKKRMILLKQESNEG